MLGQISLFGNYKIDKPIRLIELFAGIGAQAKALERLGVPFEHYRICEFDKYAVCSYNAVHGTNFKTSDIREIHAANLGIEETNKYCYIMTYSFPCQDLSIAGKGKGMKKGNQTRSGLLWEVERLLKEIMTTGAEHLPQVLLMENVPQVISKKNMHDFQMWLDFLTSIGYQNSYEILNAKDYGIPQNRARCFMVSILSEEFYEFPEKQPLTLKLKDLLEKEVDSKYFLTDGQIEIILASSYLQNRRRIQNKDVYDTLCARDFKDPKCIQIGSLKGGKWDKINESCRRVYIEDGLSPTVTAMGGGNQEPKVAIVDDIYKSREPRIYKDTAPTLRVGRQDFKVLQEQPHLLIREATKKGYKEAMIGDGIYTNRVEVKRGTVQKDMIQTLKTSPSDVGVVVEKPKCLNSKGGRKGIEGLQPSLQDRVYDSDGISTAVTTSYMPNFTDGLAVRKLTPKECWRLMGFDDDDFEKARRVLNDTFYKGNDRSSSQLYKQAGNSIVVNVLEAIFKQLIDKE